MAPRGVFFWLLVLVSAPGGEKSPSGRTRPTGGGGVERFSFSVFFIENCSRDLTNAFPDALPPQKRHREHKAKSPSRTRKVRKILTTSPSAISGTATPPFPQVAAVWQRGMESGSARVRCGGRSGLGPKLSDSETHRVALRLYRCPLARPHLHQLCLHFRGGVEHAKVQHISSSPRCSGRGRAVRADGGTGARPASSNGVVGPGGVSVLKQGKVLRRAVPTRGDFGAINGQAAGVGGRCYPQTIGPTFGARGQLSSLLISAVVRCIWPHLF